MRRLHLKSVVCFIVAANRQGIYQGKQHDFIYGAVANDDVYRTITLYMTGILTKDETLARLKKLI
ncbi:MAG: DUF3990 domain-containing protein [Lachnospiraceae bacterium]